MNNKRILLLLLLITVLSGSLYAADFGVSLKGGVNLAKSIGGDVSDEYQLLIVPVVALGLRLNILDMFAVQPEVLYSIKGEMVENNGVNIKFTRHYLEIPILLKITPNFNEKLYPNIYVGPALGINTVADIKSEGVSSTSGETGIYKDIDFGIAMGAGVGAKLKSNRIVFDVRYTLGLINIYDLPREYSFKNGALSIMLGYEINF